MLGKHSGRHALRQALEELGFRVDGQALNTAFKRFKEIADKKKQVTAMDLEALVTDELRERAAGATTLEWFDVEASLAAPAARDGRRAHARRARRSRARSPATARSTRSSARSTRRPGIDARLREFRVDAVTGGQDALGEASVVLELEGAVGGRARASRPTSSRRRRVAYVRALTVVVHGGAPRPSPMATDAVATP